MVPFLIVALLVGAVTARALRWAIRQDRAERLHSTFERLVADLPAPEWPENTRTHFYGDGHDHGPDPEGAA